MAEPALSEPNGAELRAPGAAPLTPAPDSARVGVETDKLTAMYGKFTAVKGVNLAFPANRVHALIGPSGCGKSTFLRALNRMHELSEGGWITGRVLLDDVDIYGGTGDPGAGRRRVGMGFPRPPPLPPLSVPPNAGGGPPRNGPAP